MKRKKNKTLRRTLGFIALVLVVVILAAMPLMASGRAPEEEYPLSILSARAENREIEFFLSGGGSLQQEEGQSVSVPTEVKLTEFLVKNGDTVKAGDSIARVDRVSVMAAIADTQASMDEIAKELENARTDATTQTVKAPKGLVKAVYAKPGDSVEEVMLEHGALALISLDSLMAVQVETVCSLVPGSTVTVKLNGEELEGTVKMNLNGLLTVTIPDKGYAQGQSVSLFTTEGAPLGEGQLYVHAPWHAVAYSGTVNLVYAWEGKTIYSGGTVLTIKDMGYSAEYRALAVQYREYEEQMLKLFTLYQSLTLTAPCDGLVSGIDEHSTQLLKAQDGWQVTLLANAPTGDPDASYYNFVGQLTAIGTDGKAILRVAPGFISVSDYSDTSGISRDTAAMTAQIETYLTAPVFQWVGEGSQEGTGGSCGETEYPDRKDPTQESTGQQEPSPEDPTRESTGQQEPDPKDPTQETEPSQPQPSEGEQEPPQTVLNPGWTISGCTIGDILLFSGDASGNIVWMIRLGSAAVPGGTGGTGGTGGGPGGLGGLGGITIPSFGGSYGGYGSYGGIQEEQAVPGPEEVEVALVTPTDTMTLDIVIDELDLRKVALGQQVNITVDALIGSSFEGTVTKIGQTGTNSGGSSKFTVTVTLQRRENMLSGMNAAVTIPLGSETGLALPVAALYQEGSRTLVYTALDEKTGEPTAPVEITTGLSDGEFVLVEGLEADAAVYYGYYEALDTASAPQPMRP